jgi:soluble lytic murein transglycosylase-like protein
MTDAVRKRYDANYRATDSAIQLQNDMAAVTAPRTAGSKYVPYRQNGQYDDLLNEAGLQYGVDPRLLKAIMTQESGGNSNAISRAGAKGLMQLCRQILIRLALQTGLTHGRILWPGQKSWPKI